MSGAPAHPLLAAVDAVGVIHRAECVTGVTNLWSLCDLYHLTVNGDDPQHAIATYAERIGHVQIADAPGRHEPGTGQLPIDGYLLQLTETGHAGWVGLEYLSSGASADSFAWLPPVA